MKIQQRLCLPGARFARRRGFALIATLTLMMLLAMIATALMATAASQNRIAMQTVLQAEARQQALIGLDAAIGELQAQLGADQRVTASSGVTSENESGTPQHLLGVWDSWDGPIYGTGRTGKSKSKIQDTYTQGRASRFRKWLISSRSARDTRDFKAAKSLCSRRPGQRICMVGAGTLGRSLDNTHWVYADLLSMPSTGKNQACFAWWVGGENQKAKLSVEDPEETTDPIEMLHRTWNTPAPMVVDNRDLDFVPSRVEHAAKLTTLNSLPLLDSSSQPAGTPYFFDVTTASYSLPVNVSMGGLKQDLCLLLNKETLKGTEFAARSNQDCPLVEGGDVPVGTESNMPIGSWQTLYAYYNCWPNGDEGSNGFAARMQGNLSSAYTRMSGAGYTASMADLQSPVASSDERTFFDTRSLLDQGSSTAGYARTPVMLAFISNFALVSERAPMLEDEEGKKTVRYNLGVGFAPMALMWNPYNVPMRVRGGQMWTHTRPYKTMWLQFNNFDAKNGRWDTLNGTQQWVADNFYEKGDWKNLPGGNLDGKGYGAGNARGFGAEYASPLYASRNNQSSDIVFQPGEVLFFCPDAGSDSQGNQSTSLVIGYDPTALCVPDLTKNAFHPNVPASEVDAGNIFLKLTLGINDGKEFKYPASQVNPTDLLDARFRMFGQLSCITVLNGVGGLQSLTLNKDLEKDSESQDGRHGIMPHSMMLGWYNTAEMTRDQLYVCDPSHNDSVWSTSQNDSSTPYFVTALGVVTKSANTNPDTRILPGGDYRGKLWQHSNPALSSSVSYNPSDQERQYLPYQLAVLPVSGGLGSSPIDNVGNNGYLGITSDGEQVSFASVLELPVHPPFSLAGLAGMRLTPGWYRSSESGTYAAVAAARRMQYQGGVPGVGIGNSFADPTIPAAEVYAYHQTNTAEFSSRIQGNQRLFGDFFDHGLLINDAMWDRWFMSSVSDMPTGKGVRKAQEVLSDFLSGKEQLPVARYKKSATPYNDAQVISRLMEGDGWKYIAQYLMIDGGFNVNSTSVEAWTAVLQGLARRKLVTGDGNRLSQVEGDKSDSQVLFSRFMHSTTDKSVDSLGGYSMLQGSSRFRNSGMLNAWGEVRMLEPESIRRLAEEMVKQVRKRGPFLSMSDFINRRLTTGETGLKGALQAAIDATDINRDFQDVIVQPQNGGNLYANPDAERGSMYTAAPGYLIQSDVLMSLGNILTVRDDTFTVRAYGCVKSASNAILAQAWCEAVVQRTMNYVDPTNDPSDAEYNPDGTKGKGLTKLNRVLGRRFQVVSFKWLDVWDI
ncbi:MAG: hypothetical protein ACI4O9_03180 [Akkermansia sp.]